MKRSGQAIELDNELLRRIGAIADEQEVEAYVVGGYVRDRLLGKDVRDIDIVVVGDALAFAARAAKALGGAHVVAFEKFGTAMLHIGDGKVEFVTARAEAYEPSSRKPTVTEATLESDLARRDFTVNALAASINRATWGDLRDPFGGIRDMHRKYLRTPLDPGKTFDDDPLRMMRAVRFAAQLDFEVDPAALEAVAEKADRIKIVSAERITEEFLKLLATPRPSVGLQHLVSTGLAKHVFPELAEMVGVEQRKDYHHKDVFLHTCKVVDNICPATEDVWLRFAALVHDIAKPRTKAFKEGIGWTFHGHEDLGARMMKPLWRRMKLPLDKLPYVEKLVRLHLRPMVLVSEEVTDSAVRRLLFEAGPDIDDLMVLCRADITSQNPGRVSRYLKNYDMVLEKMKEVEEKDRLRNWQPPVRGDEIMLHCQLQPGPLVGVLKKRIEEAILDGLIPNEHDAALSYLLSIKDEVLQEHQSEL